MKIFTQSILYLVLLLITPGCGNTSKEKASNSPETTDTTNIAAITDANAVIEEVEPFKGTWIHKENGEYNEENGLTFGHYEMRLVLNFYEKNIYNGFQFGNGGFYAANDRKSGDCEILSFKINGNEANIRYKAMSGATCTAKLIYHPEDHSMTFIDGEIIAKNDMEDFIISEFQIVEGKTKLTFEGKNVINTHYTNLVGTVSNNKIRMCLNENQNEEKKVDGHYCYTKHNKSLFLRGSKEYNTYTLNEMNDGDITATFTLKKKADSIWEGIWTDGINTLPVKLQELDEL